MFRKLGTTLNADIFYFCMFLILNSNFLIRALSWPKFQIYNLYATNINQDLN